MACQRPDPGNESCVGLIERDDRFQIAGVESSFEKAVDFRWRARRHETEVSSRGS
jgi:hypothetical protein